MSLCWAGIIQNSEHIIPPLKNNKHEFNRANVLPLQQLLSIIMKVPPEELKSHQPMQGSGAKIDGSTREPIKKCLPFAVLQSEEARKSSNDVQVSTENWSKWRCVLRKI